MVARGERRESAGGPRRNNLIGNAHDAELINSHRSERGEGVSSFVVLNY